MRRNVRPRPALTSAGYPLFDAFWDWLRLAPGALVLAIPVAAQADATVPPVKSRTPTTDKRPVPPPGNPPQVKGVKPTVSPPIPLGGKIPAPLLLPPPNPPAPVRRTSPDVTVNGGLGRVQPPPKLRPGDKSADVAVEKTPCPLPPAKNPPPKPGGGPPPPAPPAKTKPGPAAPKPSPDHIDGFGAHVVPPVPPPPSTRTVWLSIHRHGPDEPCVQTLLPEGDIVI